LHETSNIPENTLGGEQAISNTSGIAMEVLYQPLVEFKKIKEQTYCPGFADVNKMLLKLYDIKNAANFEGQLQGIDKHALFENEIIFRDTLPKDRLVMLQEIQYRMSSPFPTITPPMALEMLGISPRDIPEMIEEIKKWMPLMQPQQGGNMEGANSPQPEEKSLPPAQEVPTGDEQTTDTATNDQSAINLGTIGTSDQTAPISGFNPLSNL